MVLAEEERSQGESGALEVGAVLAIVLGMTNAISPNQGQGVFSLWGRGFLILLLLSSTALLLGRYPISLSQIRDLLFFRSEDPAVGIILLNVRLPRVLSALFTGAALSGAGTLFQTVFKNPMVSPSVMGASTGAAFGAALAILLGLSPWLIQVGAFFMGTLAVVVAMIVASFVNRRSRILMLVLAGMLVSTFFSALISLLKYTADPLNTLPAITYWLMGSLSGSDMRGTLFTGAVVFLCASILYGMRWKITALSLVLTMGISPVPYRYAVIVCSSLMTSAAVSQCGVIGWVGLVVPHLVRLIRPGERFGNLFVYSLTGGAAYLLIIDTAIRILTPLEFPLGIMTALIGAPFFALVILRKKGGS